MAGGAQIHRANDRDQAEVHAGFACSGYRTKVVPTRHRMSKRFNEFPGLRIQREQRVAVVVDTSGSIAERSLALFFREIHGV